MVEYVKGNEQGAGRIVQKQATGKTQNMDRVK